MTASRRKRESPARDHPDRGAGLTGGARSARGGISIDDAVGEGMAAARKIALESQATMKDVVERGVDTAYMVIEEYMLSGRRAAGNHHARKNGGGAVDQKPNNQDWMNSFGPMPPFMAPWMAAMKMWTDTMSQMTLGGPAAGRAWMDQMMAMSAPWWGAGAPLAPRISYEVSSKSPAEVSATLDPTACFARLNIEALKSNDASKAAINHVGITATSGHVCVRVTIPDSQPTGRYTATVQDETGARRGEVVVEVKARTGASAKTP